MVSESMTSAVGGVRLMMVPTGWGDSHPLGPSPSLSLECSFPCWVSRRRPGCPVDRVMVAEVTYSCDVSSSSMEGVIISAVALDNTGVSRGRDLLRFRLNVDAVVVTMC